MNPLYEMKLHESIPIPNGNALRVPGGWIYTITTQTYSGYDESGYSLFKDYATSVFVPYNSEFE